MGNFLLPGSYDKNLGQSFAWEHELKSTDDFLLTTVFASNLNIINLKLYRKHGESYRFRKNSRNLLER